MYLVTFRGTAVYCMFTKHRGRKITEAKLRDEAPMSVAFKGQYHENSMALLLFYRIVGSVGAIRIYTVTFSNVKI
jgi:hypothetical protein